MNNFIKYGSPPLMARKFYDVFQNEMTATVFGVQMLQVATAAFEGAIGYDDLYQLIMDGADLQINESDYQKALSATAILGSDRMILISIRSGDKVNGKEAIRVSIDTRRGSVIESSSLCNVYRDGYEIVKEYKEQLVDEAADVMTNAVEALNLCIQSCETVINCGSASSSDFTARMSAFGSQVSSSNMDLYSAILSTMSNNQTLGLLGILAECSVSDEESFIISDDGTWEINPNRVWYMKNVLSTVVMGVAASITQLVGLAASVIRPILGMTVFAISSILNSLSAIAQYPIRSQVDSNAYLPCLAVPIFSGRLYDRAYRNSSGWFSQSIVNTLSNNGLCCMQAPGFIIYMWNSERDGEVYMEVYATMDVSASDGAHLLYGDYIAPLEAFPLNRPAFTMPATNAVTWNTACRSISKTSWEQKFQVSPWIHTNMATCASTCRTQSRSVVPVSDELIRDRIAGAICSFISFTQNIGNPKSVPDNWTGYVTATWNSAPLGVALARLATPSGNTDANKSWDKILNWISIINNNFGQMSGFWIDVNSGIPQQYRYSVIDCLNWLFAPDGYDEDSVHMCDEGDVFFAQMHSKPQSFAVYPPEYSAASAYMAAAVVALTAIASTVAYVGVRRLIAAKTTAFLSKRYSKALQAQELCMNKLQNGTVTNSDWLYSNKLTRSYNRWAALFGGTAMAYYGGGVNRYIPSTTMFSAFPSSTVDLSTLESKLDQVMRLIK